MNQTDTICAASCKERTLHELLFRLPTCVVGQLISEWLMITDVCKLDSACTNVNLRRDLLSLFSSGDVIYETIPRPISLLATIPNLLLWLNQRRIPMSTIEITPQLDLVLLDKYLQITACKLSFLSIQNMYEGTDDIVDMLSCKELNQLRTIRCAFSIIGSTFHSILRLLHPLDEIRFKSCFDLHANIFVDVSLSHLRTVTITSCNADNTFIISLATACKKLEFLNLCECGPVGDEAVVSIAHNCKSLKLISLGGLNITDAAMVELSENCPGLVLVDIGECPQLTNLSIFSLTHSCRGLQRLYMGGNDNYTDAALAAVVQHCSPLFEVLHVVDCPAITSEGIVHLIERCPKLITLYLGGSRSNYSENDIPTIIKKCRTLEKLCLEMSAVGEGVLECIALNCPRMAEIGLFHVSDGITEAGLVALATRCTKLELLVLHPDCEVMTSFAKHLWVLLRPGLEIHTEEEDELAFDVETQIDWYSNT